MKQFLLWMFFLNSLTIFAQQPGAFYSVKTNVSFGADYHSLRFNGGTVYFSGGGGIGAEFEYGYYLTNRFGLGIKGGFQQVINYHYYKEIGSYSVKTSAFFNRKTIAPFAELLLLDKPEKTINAIRLTAGYSLNFSGDLKQTENDRKQPDFEYDNPGGVTIQLMGSLNLGNLIKSEKRIWNSNLLAGIGWHNLTFTKTNTAETGNELRKFDGSGLELILGFRRKI